MHYFSLLRLVIPSSSCFKHEHTPLSTSVNHISVISLPVPCAPQNVKYSGDGRTAVLSWNASVFATWYSVYNVTGAGRIMLCNTTGLFCQLTDFDPGTHEVTASNVKGESIPSLDITGQSQGENICSPAQESKK